MKSGKLNVLGSLQADTMVKIYDNTLASPATTVTISGLDGNAHEEYELIVRGVGAGNPSSGPYIGFNNDTTDGNYGCQLLYGNDGSAGAVRLTANRIVAPNFSASGQIDTFSLRIWAKSGYIRTAIFNQLLRATGVTVTQILLDTYIWNNTVDNMTSIYIGNGDTNSLNTGTHIELWAKKAKV